MAVVTMHRGKHHARANRELWEFRILYSLCFTLFLVFAVLEALLPWPRARGERRSIVKQARETTGMVMPFAFHR